MEPLEVGRRVRAARLAAGFKQRKPVTDLAGVSRFGDATLGKVERGERMLQPHEADALARVLHVDPAAFYEQPATAQLDRIEEAVNAGREDRTVAVDAIQELLQRQSRVLANIERLLRDMQVVAAGMPTGRSVDALTRELEAQEARAQGARAARSSAAKGAGRARRTGQGG
jgi:transcriptional regulator with XRE-family HTH domain